MILPHNKQSKYIGRTWTVTALSTNILKYSLGLHRAKGNVNHVFRGSELEFLIKSSWSEEHKSWKNFCVPKTTCPSIYHLEQYKLMFYSLLRQHYIPLILCFYYDKEGNIFSWCKNCSPLNNFRSALSPADPANFVSLKSISP